MAQYIVRREMHGWWVNTTTIEAETEEQAEEIANTGYPDGSMPEWRDGEFIEDDGPAEYYVDDD